MKCECCHKELDIVFGSTKYCSRCSIYLKEIKSKITTLKKTISIRDKRLKKMEAKNLLEGR